MAGVRTPGRRLPRHQRHTSRPSRPAPAWPHPCPAHARACRVRVCRPELLRRPHCRRAALRGPLPAGPAAPRHGRVRWQRLPQRVHRGCAARENPWGWTGAAHWGSVAPAHCNGATCGCRRRVLPQRRCEHPGRHQRDPPSQWLIQPGVRCAGASVGRAALRVAGHVASSFHPHFHSWHPDQAGWRLQGPSPSTLPSSGRPPSSAPSRPASLTPPLSELVAASGRPVVA